MTDEFTELAGLRLSEDQVEQALFEYGRYGWSWPEIETAFKSGLIERSRRTAQRQQSDGNFRLTRDGQRETLWLEGEDATGPMMLQGLASTPTTTLHGGKKQSLSSAGCVIRLPVPLRWRHERQGSQIGEVVWAQKSPSGIHIRACLDDDEAGRAAWEMIQSGELRALSVGPTKDASTYIMKKFDGVNYYVRWQMQELSLTPRGANPDCFCEPICAGKDVELKGPVIAPKIQIRDMGVWNSLEVYLPGEICSHRGSAWVCRTKQCTMFEPGTPHGAADWRLIAKRGRNQKGSRPAEPARILKEHETS